MLRDIRRLAGTILPALAVAMATSSCGIKGPLTLPPKAASPGRHRTRGRQARRAAVSRAVSAFVARNGELHAEGVPLSRIADQHGTPCFVYSRAALESNFRAFDDALRASRTSSATR